MKSPFLPVLLALAPAALCVAGPTSPAVPATEPVASDWLADTIPPVTNPVFFEDPVIRSEVRPIYIRHQIDSGFITGGGDVDLFAVQFRYAFNDRLALIATKDGYINIDLDSGASADGWADLSLGLKYALIDDRANQFILTPGFTFEVPTGSNEVFQGNGDGELNLFVSAAKGFDKFHLTGNAGIRIPFDGDDESAILHYSLMADVKVCRWFQPFIALNGITVVDEGRALPLTTEGYDLINFGSALADGETQITFGGGFRSRLTDSLSLGVAYEQPITDPHGLYDDRLTVDMIWNF
jgi:Putative MetA-pathway of phenol degradation